MFTFPIKNNVILENNCVILDEFSLYEFTQLNLFD